MIVRFVFGLFMMILSFPTCLESTQKERKSGTSLFTQTILECDWERDRSRGGNREKQRAVPCLNNEY